MKVTRGNTTNIERLTIGDAAALADMLNGYVTMYGEKTND
jgi:hypothetical protein